ncbi:Trimeric GatFAB AmidoTransferase(AdT) complex subunit [Elasticomyces elasticus]|nr:Trimeric GatFAB AmidoTransferase(AdT) complex subunit [Elasticomyces elasticus]
MAIVLEIFFVSLSRSDLPGHSGGRDRDLTSASAQHFISKVKNVMLSARFCWRNASRSCQVYRKSHRKSADASGFLSGKTVAVKDNIVTKDLPTTAASKILTDYIPPFDATVVKLLQQHGAIISAKTNLDEFGMGSHSQHSHAGAVLSPFSKNGVPLSPGGSSGGSAVSVATGQCWAALGTDTGGSVRLPAAYTGIVGFKPSYGLLSRWGVIQYANSLDTVGILARSVADTKHLYGCINAYDQQDPTSLSATVRERLGRKGADAKRLRIGVPLEYNIDELSPVVRATYLRTLNALQNAGHTLQPVSLPTTQPALSAYYVLAPAEASSNLAKYDGIRYGYRTPGSDASAKNNLPLYASTRGEGFGEEVQRRILLGAYTLSSEAIDNYFIQAQKVRRLVQRDFDSVFAQQHPLLERQAEIPSDEGGVDVLLTPTAPTLPPTIKEVKQQSPVESYMNDVFTVPASLAGLPAISVPVRIIGREGDGLEETDVHDVGMQLIGQFGDDELVLQAAEVVVQ